MLCPVPLRDPGPSFVTSSVSQESLLPPGGGPWHPRGGLEHLEKPLCETMFSCVVGGNGTLSGARGGICLTLRILPRASPPVHSRRGTECQGVGGSSPFLRKVSQVRGAPSQISRVFSRWSQTASPPRLPQPPDPGQIGPAGVSEVWGWGGLASWSDCPSAGAG